jgi:hypothetical protein
MPKNSTDVPILDSIPFMEDMRDSSMYKILRIFT